MQNEDIWKALKISATKTYGNNGHEHILTMLNSKLHQRDGETNFRREAEMSSGLIFE